MNYVIAFTAVALISCGIPVPELSLGGVRTPELSSAGAQTLKPTLGGNDALATAGVSENSADVKNKMDQVEKESVIFERNMKEGEKNIDKSANCDVPNSVKTIFEDDNKMIQNAEKSPNSMITDDKSEEMDQDVKKTVNDGNQLNRKESDKTGQTSEGIVPNGMAVNIEEGKIAQVEKETVKNEEDEGAEKVVELTKGDVPSSTTTDVKGEEMDKAIEETVDDITQMNQGEKKFDQSANGDVSNSIKTICKDDKKMVQNAKDNETSSTITNDKSEKTEQGIKERVNDGYQINQEGDDKIDQISEGVVLNSMMTNTKDERTVQDENETVENEENKNEKINSQTTEGAVPSSIEPNVEGEEIDQSNKETVENRHQENQEGETKIDQSAEDNVPNSITTNMKGEKLLQVGKKIVKCEEANEGEIKIDQNAEGGVPSNMKAISEDDQKMNRGSENSAPSIITTNDKDEMMDQSMSETVKDGNKMEETGEKTIDQRSEGNVPNSLMTNIEGEHMNTDICEKKVNEGEKNIVPNTTNFENGMMVGQNVDNNVVSSIITSSEGKNIDQSMKEESKGGNQMIQDLKTAFDENAKNIGKRLKKMKKKMASMLGCGKETAERKQVPCSE